MGFSAASVDDNGDDEEPAPAGPRNPLDALGAIPNGRLQDFFDAPGPLDAVTRRVAEGQAELVEHIRQVASGYEDQMAVAARAAASGYEDRMTVAARAAATAIPSEPITPLPRLDIKPNPMPGLLRDIATAIEIQTEITKTEAAKRALGERKTLLLTSAVLFVAIVGIVLEHVHL